VTGTAETKTENAEIPPSPNGNNTLFAAVTNLNAHLTALHAALSPRTALLLFSGHSDPRSMSTLSARRAEYQASQKRPHGNQNSPGAAMGTGGGAVRWSTADVRALEEAVVLARMGLSFVGVKI
jgi:RNA exonuclease 1